MAYYLNQSKPESIYNIFNDLLNDPLLDSAESKRRANIISKEKEIQIQLECPGIKKDEIELSCENGILKVECKTQKQEKQKYLDQQFLPQDSTNLFTLSNELDTNKIKASNKDGILYINIPRKQHKTKRIEIS